MHSRFAAIFAPTCFLVLMHCSTMGGDKPSATLVASKPPDITERPPRITNSGYDDLRLSHMYVAMKLDMSRLGAIIDDTIPETIANFSGERGGCFQTKVVFLRISIGCTWHGEIKRRGAVSLQGNGDTLNIAVPIHAWVTVKSRSGISVQETATADFTVIVSIRPKLDSDWHLSLDIDTDFRWDKRAEIELLGFIKISVGSLAEPLIRERLLILDELVKAQSQEYFQIRRYASELWKTSHRSLKISSKPDLWLSVLPKAVDRSEIRVQGRSLAVDVLIKSEVTIVSEEPVLPMMQELPKLGRKLEQTGGFSVVVPVAVKYKDLEKEVESLLNAGRRWAPIEEDPTAILIVEDVEIYPSSPDIIVGVQLSMEFADDGSRSRGTVYFAGRPVVDNANRAVRLEGLGLTRFVDAGTVSVSAARFANLLSERLQHSLGFEFGLFYNQIRDSVNRQLSREVYEGLSIDGHLDEARAEVVILLDEFLYIGVRATGAIGVSYDIG